MILTQLPFFVDSAKKCLYYYQKRNFVCQFRRLSFYPPPILNNKARRTARLCLVSYFAFSWLAGQRLAVAKKSSCGSRNDTLPNSSLETNAI